MQWKQLSNHQQICKVRFDNWTMQEVLEAIKVAGKPYGDQSSITWWISDRDPNMLNIHALRVGP